MSNVVDRMGTAAVCLGSVFLLSGLSGVEAVGQPAAPIASAPSQVVAGTAGDGAAAPVASVLACDTATGATQRAAIAKARETLHAVWLEGKAGYFALYTMPGEKRNPFDLSKPVRDAGPRDGVVQARPPRCVMASDPDGGRHVISFTSPYFRFHEAGAGWSPPMRDGLLMAIEVVTAGDALIAKDLQSPTGVLEPEQKARRPAETALPKPTRWAPPIPPCQRSERWDGAECVARKR
ncbi:MAG: hypothetical protein SFW09_02385 [Hyphomicrobiaceae bacterium]|nr:hypothetical protein [Hyphomicrobiaceae bacterium]